MSRAARRIAAFGLSVAAVAAVVGSLDYTINTTRSMPRGLWQINRTQLQPQPGDIAVFCPPDTPPFQMARARGYIGAGRCPGDYQPMIKPVIAIPGDFVENLSSGVQVNGRQISEVALATVDADGRMLTPAAGSFSVGEGSVWVMSTRVPNSFDSRYFGTIPQSAIIGWARPVLTEQ